jgi:hypothetical protein
MPWPGRKLRWHDASVVVKGLAVPVVSRENVVGQDVVAQELRRLALDRSQCRIGLGLVFVDVDAILHRSVRG